MMALRFDRSAPILCLLFFIVATGAPAQIGCTIAPESEDLGFGCGNFMGMDPVLTIDPPAVGRTINVNLNSDFPNAFFWIFFSAGTPTPVDINGQGMIIPPGAGPAMCTIRVDLFDLSNLALLVSGFTDANGDVTIPITLPSDQAWAGLELTFQSRVCAPNAPITGPAQDWFSNAVRIRTGCEQACLIIIDEDGIDNGISTIEAAANALGVTDDFLVNDDMPTETSNPWLRWNTLAPGTIVTLPTGEVDDEGWFALPPNPPFNVQSYVDGTVPQSQLDPIPDVMPIRNQDIFAMIGLTCVAVVYDSDISMNYLPIQGNLQGARYGLFAFTILDVQVPGALPESQSSTSLYDVIVRVEPPLPPTFAYQIPIRDHEPDAIEITLAEYDNGTVTVWGESDFSPGAIMTVSIDGFVLEAPMTYDAARDRYEYTAITPMNLDGRRVLISTDEGGSYNEFIQ